MIILPAIDIIQGSCVRLTQGDYDKVKKYDQNPTEVVKSFQNQGAEFIHIVDLEGAKDGYPVNQKTVLGIVKNTNLPVQIGGGIRNFEDAKTYLDNGIKRVIIGTSAIEDPTLIKEIIKNFDSNRVIISIDVKDEMVATKGWKEVTKINLFDLLNNLKNLGIKKVIVTDINKDGMLEGPNTQLYKKVIDAGFEVIAAGGISTIEDVKTLAKIGVDGIIIGKAIYEKNIDLTEAITLPRLLGEGRGEVSRRRLESDPASKTRTEKIPRQATPATPLQKGNYKNNLAKRIIPCMDVDGGRVVKGTHFKELRDAGDPVELGKLYSEQGADELVFLDITATVDKRKTVLDLVEKVAKNINIPFTIGGGISTVEDIKALLSAGADKVSIGSNAVTNTDFIKQASKQFGAQCIVISVDAKKDGNDWKVYIKGGREKTDLDAIEFAKEMENLGAGELLVNSLDKDGTKDGYDLELLKKITEAVNIPIIASSGAGIKEDFLEVFEKTEVDAALAATLFHYKELEIPDLKKYLKNNNINIRI